jgi:fumarate reductase flavoprotein subunit
VVLVEGGIAEIVILEHGDDGETGGAAMEELLDLVLLYNTTGLDAVSGATESSRGFLSAVEDALSKAGVQ